MDVRHSRVKVTSQGARLSADDWNALHIVTMTEDDVHDNYQLLGVTVVTYGADNTGATVCDEAFTQALADARANGGKLSIPPGKYKLSTAITSGNKINGVGYPPLHVYGGGQEKTQLVIGDNSAFIFGRETGDCGHGLYMHDLSIVSTASSAEPMVKILQMGRKWIVERVNFHGSPLENAGRSFTASASTDVFTSSSHGFHDGDIIGLSSMTGGGGLSIGTPYYVIEATTNTFKVSTTLGGSAVNITSDATAGTASCFYDRIGIQLHTSWNGSIRDCNFWKFGVEGVSSNRAAVQIKPQLIAATGNGPINNVIIDGCTFERVMTGIDLHDPLETGTETDINNVTITNPRFKNTSTKGYMKNSVGIRSNHAFTYAVKVNEAFFEDFEYPIKTKGTLWKIDTPLFQSANVCIEIGSGGGVIVDSPGLYPGPNNGIMVGVKATSDVSYKCEVNGWGMIGAPIAKAFTASAATNFLTCAGHGFTNGTQVLLTNITGATPLVGTKFYYVTNSGADILALSETPGGAIVGIDTDGTVSIVSGGLGFATIDESTGSKLAVTNITS